MSRGVQAARQCCPTAQEQVPCTGLVRWRCCPTNFMHSASMNSNADKISPSIPLQVLNVCRTSANPGQPATGHSASGTTEGRTAGPRASPIAWQGHPLLSNNISQLTCTRRVAMKGWELRETLHSSAHKFISRSPDLKLCLRMATEHSEWQKELERQILEKSINMGPVLRAIRNRPFHSPISTKV